MSDAKPSPAAAPHLVLVGNGDAHRHVVANADRLTRAGARVTLVTRDDFWFRDWLGGMLGGEWQIDELRLPANRITARGGTHIAADVGEVDLAQRRLSLTDGSRLTYDWLSLDLSPRIDERRIPGFYTASAVFLPFPEDLWTLRQRLETELAGEARVLPSVVVVGGGPVGVELAANLLALGERYGRRLPVTLISDDRRLLPDAPKRANRWLVRRLSRRGLQIELVAKATRYEERRLILDDGSPIQADYLLVTDADRPPALLDRMLIDQEPARDVMVEDTLRCQADPRLFLTHASLRNASLRSAAARERAECLLDNLERSIRGQALEPCITARMGWRALNLGDLRDIAWRGHLWCYGRWVRRLKHRRDRYRVSRYRSLSPSSG